MAVATEDTKQLHALVDTVLFLCLVIPWFCFHFCGEEVHAAVQSEGFSLELLRHQAPVDGE